MSIEEIISLLKKTSLPTVVIEGNDDMVVYRSLEERLAHLGVSMLPVGGRQKVLKIFERMSEISGSIKLAFIADKDVWVTVGVPPEYVNDHLVFTEGYSIENDVFVDGELWRLLNRDEFSRFEIEVRDFVEWYALALSRFLRDNGEQISRHPDYVLNPQERPRLLALRAGEAYPDAMRDSIFALYKYQLRGKSLLNLLVRNTNRGGGPHHTDGSLLASVAIRPGANLNRIMNRVAAVMTV
jgi:hypothetical protein